MNRSILAMALWAATAHAVPPAPTGSHDLAWTLPVGTAIPVEFTQLISLSHARPGDIIRTRIMQVVRLPDGHTLPRGTLLLGRIVQANPGRGDQGISVLAFRLDTILLPGGTLPVRTYVRALAGNLDSYDSLFPTPPSSENISNTRTLIGGDQVTPNNRKVYASDGAIVGENLKDGVFERLQPGQSADRNSTFSCDGTTTLESVAIYSGSACGLYGFGDASLASTGKHNHGIIELDSPHPILKIFPHSTALLQIAPDGPED